MPILSWPREVLHRSPRPIGKTRPLPETTPLPVEPRIRSVVIVLMLAAILTVFGARCVWIAKVDAITCDEATYLLHSLHYWMTGDDLRMWELGSPRLPHVIGSFPAYLSLRSAGMLPTGLTGDDLTRAINGVVLEGSSRLLMPTRLMAILWGQVLLVLVFWAVARTGRPALGLVATALTAMTPEVVAHASIAGSDLPFTAAAFGSLIMLTRYAERPSPGRWLAAALTIGLAWAMRHTGIVLVMAAGLVHLVVQWRRSRPRGVWDHAEWLFGSVWAGAALATVAFLGLWVGDGLGLVTMGELADRVTMLRVPQQLGPLDIAGVPIPDSLLSLLKQIRHQNAGHEAYFLGEYSTTGWLTYFPVAFLLKTPIGLLALLILTVALVRPKGVWDAVAIGFLALLWFMLVRNKVNIGLRYALLTYPLAATFAARLFEPSRLRDRLWGPLTVGALLMFVWASIACGTRCLSSFNEIGGGPHLGWLYLADSNVDWGQDFDRLREVIRARGITEVTLDMQPERPLGLPGVLAVVNPSNILQAPAITPPNRRLHDAEGGYIPVYTRYVAVGITRLFGLYSRNDLSWLWTREVVARVGDSIILFDMDTPARRPLYEPDPREERRWLPALAGFP